MVNLDDYNPHKQKLFGVLNNYRACHRVLRTKKLTTAGLMLPQQERIGEDMKNHGSAETGSDQKRLPELIPFDEVPGPRS